MIKHSIEDQIIAFKMIMRGDLIDEDILQSLRSLKYRNGTIDRSDAVNLAYSIKSADGARVTAEGILTLTDAVLLMDEGIHRLERKLYAAEARVKELEAAAEVAIEECEDNIPGGAAQTLRTVLGDKP